MDFAHLNRAEIYNNKWFTKYRWIMPFVNSEKLGYEVAIAGLGDNLVLITRDGTPIQIIDNY